VPYLSALEVRSRRGAIQIHVYLTLPSDGSYIGKSDSAGEVMTYSDEDNHWSWWVIIIITMMMMMMMIIILYVEYTDTLVNCS